MRSDSSADVFGQLTDQLMTYNVRGSIGEPVVTASLGKPGQPSSTTEEDDTPKTEEAPAKGDGG